MSETTERSRESEEEERTVLDVVENGVGVIWFSLFDFCTYAQAVPVDDNA